MDRNVNKINRQIDKNLNRLGCRRVLRAIFLAFFISLNALPLINSNPLDYEDVYIDGPFLTIEELWQEVSNRSPYKVIWHVNDNRKRKIRIQGLKTFDELLGLTKEYFRNEMSINLVIEVKNQNLLFKGREKLASKAPPKILKPRGSPVLYDEIYIDGPDLSIMEIWAQVEKHSPYRVQWKISDPNPQKIKIDGLTTVQKLIYLTRIYFKERYSHAIEVSTQGQQIIFEESLSLSSSVKKNNKELKVDILRPGGIERLRLGLGPKKITDKVDSLSQLSQADIYKQRRRYSYEFVIDEAKKREYHLMPYNALVKLKEHGITLLPSASIKSTFNDNIYNTLGTRESDFINEIKAGFKASMGNRHKMSLKYGVSSNFFGKNPDENFAKQNGGGDFTYNPQLPLSTSLGVDFKRDASPRQEERQIRSVFTDLTLKTGLKYQFQGKKMSIGFDVSENALRYENQVHQNLNRDLQKYKTDFVYKLSPKINFKVKASSALTQFTDLAFSGNSADHRMNNISSEVNWIYSKKMTFTFGTLFQEIDFDNQLDSVGQSNDNRDLIGYKLKGTYNLWEAYTFNIDLNKEIKSTKVKASVEYQKNLLSNLKFNTKLSASNTDLNKVDVASRIDRTYIGSASIKYILFKKFHLSADYTHTSVNSDDQTRDEFGNIFSVNASMNL